MLFFSGSTTSPPSSASKLRGGSGAGASKLQKSGIGSVTTAPLRHAPRDRLLESSPAAQNQRGRHDDPIAIDDEDDADDFQVDSSAKQQLMDMAGSSTIDMQPPPKATGSRPTIVHLQTEIDEEEEIVKAEEESRLSALDEADANAEAEALEVLKAVTSKFDQPLSQHRVAELGSVDYDLRAVVHHRGRRATSGHYVTDVRTIQDQHPDRWSRFDDAYHHDQFSEIQATATESEGSAYILYYVRRASVSAEPSV